MQLPHLPLLLVAVARQTPGVATEIETGKERGSQSLLGLMGTDSLTGPSHRLGTIGLQGAMLRVMDGTGMLAGTRGRLRQGEDTSLRPEKLLLARVATENETETGIGIANEIEMAIAKDAMLARAEREMVAGRGRSKVRGHTRTAMETKRGLKLSHRK